MNGTVSFIACLLLMCNSAYALAPDELLLIVNRNEPAGLELADFYVKARQLPKARVLVLELPVGEAIPFDTYERQVVPAVRKFIRDSKLEGKVRCLVPMFGLPIRIDGKPGTPADKQEIASLKQQLAGVTDEVRPVVVATEDLLKKLDPSFTADATDTFEGLARRAEIAISQLARQALAPRAQQPTTDAVKDAPARLFRAIGILAGSASLAQQFKDAQIKQLGLTEIEIAQWPERRAEAAKAQGEFSTLLERRFDTDARKRMLAIARDQFGLFGLARLINSQVDYLETDGTVSAFDNELAMLWWDWYSHVKWQNNFLHYRARAEGIARRVPPMMMVCRLDAPTPDIVRDSIILGSLKAEKDGLKGKFVVDRRGLPANSVTKEGKPDGYGPFDQTLAALANLVRDRTDLPLTLDDREAVIPITAGIDDVALYCGWYSVRRYVRAFKFNPGAVGYHIASFEMVSLHGAREAGWTSNLLRDGVASTMGPVAEPYLHAFPLPDEFFPVLLTGKLMLAETYWSTNPLASWMMCLIGDPLYNPFKANPQMTVEELPERLRGAITMDALPSTLQSPQR